MKQAANEILDKTLHGVPVNQNTFKRAICEALEKMDGGAGKVDDIIPSLGTEWDTPAGRKLVGKTLINMTANRTVVRVEGERGVYRVTGNYKRNGVSVFDRLEKSVLDSIRRRGGMARSRDIMDDHQLRQHGDELRAIKERATRAQHGTETDEDAVGSAYDVRYTTEHAQITKVMAESQLIRQDCLRRGWYNLPMEELHTMTLRGQFAAFMIQSTWEEFLKPNRVFKERDEFFSRVGDVYQEARVMRGWSKLELARRPKAHAALLDLSRNPIVRRDLSRHYIEVTQGRINEMIAADMAPADIAAYREDRRNSREGHQFIVDLLERFEKGGRGLEDDLEPAGVNIHLNAPVSFYEGLAAELEIDPVFASRGVLMLDFRGEKLRPIVETASLERRMEVQASREGRAGASDVRGTLHGIDDDDPGAANDE